MTTAGQSSFRPLGRGASPSRCAWLGLMSACSSETSDRRSIPSWPMALPPPPSLRLATPGSMRRPDVRWPTWKRLGRGSSRPRMRNARGSVASSTMERCGGLPSFATSCGVGSAGTRTGAAARTRAVRHATARGALGRARSGQRPRGRSRRRRSSVSRRTRRSRPTPTARPGASRHSSRPPPTSFARKGLPTSPSMPKPHACLVRARERGRDAIGRGRRRRGRRRDPVAWLRSGRAPSTGRDDRRPADDRGSARGRHPPLRRAADRPPIQPRPGYGSCRSNGLTVKAIAQVPSLRRRHRLRPQRR